MNIAHNTSNLTLCQSTKNLTRPNKVFADNVLSVTVHD